MDKTLSHFLREGTKYFQGLTFNHNAVAIKNGQEINQMQLAEMVHFYPESLYQLDSVDVLGICILGGLDPRINIPQLNAYSKLKKYYAVCMTAYSLYKYSAHFEDIANELDSIFGEDILFPALERTTPLSHVSQLMLEGSKWIVHTHTGTFGLCTDNHKSLSLKNIREGAGIHSITPLGAIYNGGLATYECFDFDYMFDTLDEWNTQTQDTMVTQALRLYEYFPNLKLLPKGTAYPYFDGQ